MPELPEIPQATSPVGMPAQMRERLAMMKADNSVKTLQETIFRAIKEHFADAPVEEFLLSWLSGEGTHEITLSIEATRK